MEQIKVNKTFQETYNKILLMSDQEKHKLNMLTQIQIQNTPINYKGRMWHCIKELDENDNFGIEVMLDARHNINDIIRVGSEKDYVLYQLKAKKVDELWIRYLIKYIPESAKEKIEQKKLGDWLDV